MQDEVVNTSDTEEREELDATEEFYWKPSSDPEAFKLESVPSSTLSTAPESPQHHIYDDIEDQDTDPEIQHSNRYSLRVRQAKQMNPYEFDKRFYRRQMRSNPDAIVNIVSPRKESDRSGRKNPCQDENDEETRPCIAFAPEDDHLYYTDSDVSSIVGLQRTIRNSPDYHDALEHSPASESFGERSPNIKGLRFLKKAWPAVMVNQHLEHLREPPVKRPRLSTIAHRSEDDLGALQPGQTRARNVTHSQGTMIDVRGDSESSEELSEEPVDLEGEPDVTQISQRHVRPVVEVLSSDSDENFWGADDDVDDAHIDTWLRDQARPGDHNQGDRLPRENLIDWMLSRTRTVGAPRKAKRQRPPKLHVVTSGVREDRGGRQTLLSFHKPSKTRRSTAQDGSSITASGIHHIQGQHRPAAAPHKKRRKSQREQGHASVHLFTSDSTRITSGRRRRHAITIDMEDELFYKSLAPIPCNSRDHPQTESTSLLIHPTRNQHEDTDMCHEEPLRYSQPPPRHRDIKLDFDILHLPSGITFDPNTYLGRGWLHELVALVSSGANVSEPGPYAAHGIELIPAMSVSGLLTALTSICDQLFHISTQAAGELVHWEGIMHAVCQFVSWLPFSSDIEHCHLLRSSVHEQLLRLVSRVNDCHRSLTSHADVSVAAVYTIHWFAIEMCTRLDHAFRGRVKEFTSAALVVIDEYSLLLIRHLLDYGLTRTMKSIQDRGERLDAGSTAQRTAESWICLINLLGCYDGSRDRRDGGLCWRMVHQSLVSNSLSMPSGLETSEAAWQTIFSLCALSQFSSHGMTTSHSRLSASWELVAFALKEIRLTAGPDEDRTLSERSLVKRDDYIWLIASRCFILWNRWHWSLDEASDVFRRLADIFRSRKFANLRREPSDFPGFMLNHDMRLLSQYRSSDTAFELFLKLIVHAARSGPDKNDNVQDVSPKANKLMSLAVPVGSVPFSKITPPSMHELSMLYNRFSAIAVALYLDSSPGKVHSRLAQARSYVKFKDADDTTRIACIRGAMHFAIFLQDRQIPLDDVLLWLGDMSVILVDEYSDILDGMGASHSTNATRDRLVFSIQLLLGSIRHIIETPHMDPTKSRSVYPDAGLVEGAWVTRIFSNATNLTNLTKTGVEIRRLVQAFLDARAAVIPVHRRPHPTPTVPEDNQDSQDNYGTLDLDLDDAELLAALGDEQPATDIRGKDERVCKVIEDHISPAIYRLVTKYFGEQRDDASFEEYCYDADMWISCWVGCANILVQNNKKEWSWFLRLGPQSWERIIQQSHRRRVGLHFMFTLLQLDPNVYSVQQDIFIQVLLESMVSAKITMENKYMSLLFSVDGLRHPLLSAVPCQPIPGTIDYHISKAEFLNVRLSIMKVICANLAERLHRENKGEQGLTEQNQTSVGFFVNMFSTMQDIYQQITAGAEIQLIYVKFCQQVFDIVLQYPELTLQPRLVTWVEWGSNLH